MEEERKTREGREDEALESTITCARREKEKKKKITGKKREERNLEKAKI